MSSYTLVLHARVFHDTLLDLPGVTDGELRDRLRYVLCVGAARPVGG